MFINTFLRFLIIPVLLFFPAASNAGGPILGIFAPTFPVMTESASMQITSYYDLRNRQSFVQVSNTLNEQINIHVQIFQNDREGCPELNFYDTLTPSDTHVYDMSDLSGNTNPGVNISLPEGSNGFVVITVVESATSGSPAIPVNALIGNFRIIDTAGYEYRTNSAGFPDLQTHGGSSERVQSRYTVNFNQLGGNNQSDIVGIGLINAGPGPSSVNDIPAAFEAFIFNDAENGTSCDIVEFACGGSLGSFLPTVTNVADEDLLNLGLNDVFPATNGDNFICPGNQDTSGYLDLIGSDGDFRNSFGFGLFVGFAGLNNGNGTGSMDSFVGNTQEICDFFPDGCPLGLGSER